MRVFKPSWRLAACIQRWFGLLKPWRNRNGSRFKYKNSQIVANEFKLPLNKIKITATSTGKVPNTSATAASSGSDLNGMAAKNAAEKIKSRMAEYLAAEAQIKPNEVSFEDGKF